MRWPKVSIITVNYNGKHETAGCLELVNKLTYPNFEVIVVDNASSDGSMEYLKEKFPGVIYLENKENVGWGGGLNTGMEYAIKERSKYFFTLNNDTSFEEDLLEDLIMIAESDPQIALVGPKICYYDDPKRVRSFGLNINYRFLSSPGFLQEDKIDTGQPIFHETEEVNLIDDTALLVRVEAIRDVGFYDTQYFMYCEELDLCYKIKKAGYKIVSCPKVVVWHKVSSSSGGEDFNPFVAYYRTRNKILFARKNLPKQFLITLIPYQAAVTLYHLLKAISEQRLDVALAIIQGLVWHLKQQRSKSYKYCSPREKR